MATGREVKRGQRRRREVPSVAIAGYTNAGKSSLLNRVTGSGVLVADSLFATLDSAVRRARTPSGRLFTLTDTVGFVRHLPHQLVEAFRATLEEVAQADLILHVVDGSDPDPLAQLAAVREVLREIGAGDVAELVVINKSDAADPIAVQAVTQRESNCVVVSAHTGAGIGELLTAVEGALPAARHPDMHGAALRARRPARARPRGGRGDRAAARRGRHPRPGPGTDVARGRVRAGRPAGRGLGRYRCYAA